MLPQEDLLVGLAQIALTLTGFAALVTVFRRSEDRWKPEEFLGLSIILEFSIGSAFLAMLPIAVSYLIGTPVGVWRISASIHVLSAFVYMLLTFIRGRRLWYQHKRLPIHPLIIILLTVFPTPLLILQFMNMLWLDNFAVYFVHTLYLMMVGGVQFIMFVYNYATER